MKDELRRKNKTVELRRITLTSILSQRERRKRQRDSLAAIPINGPAFAPQSRDYGAAGSDPSDQYQLYF